MTIIGFGRYNGQDISEVPEDYLEWLARDSKSKCDMAVGELNRRRTVVDESYMMKIIRAGLAALKSGSESLDDNKLAKAFKALESAIADAAKPKGPTS